MVSRMKNGLATMLMSVAALAAAVGGVSAHCQIPCGIYDDETRFTLMLEHVTTIEKSMTQIASLEKASERNDNQLVRWVNNKEAHADELSEIVTFYFMAQRVKPAKQDDKAAYGKYIQEITLLHQMVVRAMQSKQTMDQSHCVELRRLIADFRKSYAGK
ncbi:MAG: superoxide dismutase [Armatimonadetes bacterium CG07_land_8_20_14_0_80_59_28]|nr:MAG: superoxide dismutase [Armatimonadetes bacterium CG07_land_8_20_14_0_80_59_28]PIX40066.1 MAG: superoxide dismutase [Armatimonadetes bacterium CG_4_8_14_3_um_filter_58_9]PIY48755.1 MAG: superoxide dismutase [Armatimonadetes bacterium CG_4_10_14_3_um_filter_59_10]PJB64037.1 MAG: superoxide dismutase [Armatimonadetes bacterium CG_4_9_14_3_um_filter_58_7]